MSDSSTTNTNSKSDESTDSGSVVERFHDALRSIRGTVDKFKDCSAEEKAKLSKDLDQLQDMEKKLAQGLVEIVLFGEISTGKSALINALVGSPVADVNVQGGWTKEARSVDWEETDYVLPGLDESQLVIVDTPGINEVGDSDHEALARHAARRGDIIVFVTDSDLNEIEFSAIVALAAVHKPILVVLNKKDLYSKDDLSHLVDITRNQRLKGIIPPENVICTSADPREIEYVEVDDRGRETSEWRKPLPDVVDLKARILEILARDGLALVALNAAMYAADKTDRIAKLRIELREEQANQLIWRFATVKALVVALNPVAGFDALGGVVVDVSMILALAKTYGMEMTTANARSLFLSVLTATGWVAVAEYSMHAICNAFKLVSLGSSTAVSAIPQGAAAGYGAYIVGSAAKYYFENGASWGAEAPKTVVRRILAETDKDSVIQQIKSEIEQKIRSNFYSDKQNKQS